MLDTKFWIVDGKEEVERLESKENIRYSNLIQYHARS